MIATHPALLSRLVRATPALALALALSSSPAPPSIAQVRPPGSPPATAPRGRGPREAGEEALRRAYAAVEKAFERSEPDPLRRLLPRRVKIYLAAQVLEISDGYYGGDQVLLALRRLFERRVTVRFAPLEAENHPRARAVFRALWVFRENGSPQGEARLCFVFAPEDGGWTLREIRDLK